MKLFELSPVEGSKRERKRIGRGHGSGQGKTAGKGHKGQKARAGRGFRAGFEGGQMPLQRRVPKRGFNNIFATKLSEVKVGDLDVFKAGSTVGPEDFVKAGLLKKTLDGVKILGNGDISKKLTVTAAKFSASAKEKIEAAGGKCEVK